MYGDQSNFTGNELKFPVVDADELSARFSTDKATIRFEPLVDGVLRAGLSHHPLEHLVYWETCYPEGAHISCVAGGDQVLFVAPVSGATEVRWSGGSLVTCPAQGAAITNDLLSNVTVTPGRYQRIFSIPTSEMVRALAMQLGEPVQGTLRFSAPIEMDGAIGRMLQSFTAMFHEGFVKASVLGDAPLAATSFIEAFELFAIRSIPHSHSHLNSKGAIGGASWQLRRAMEYIRAHAHAPMKVEHVAAACNVSVRSLYKMFKEQRGTTPRAFLRSVRLKGAHYDLNAPDRTETVSAIARRWGFIHMGEFSAQYRRAYGELPSQRRPQPTAGKP